MPAKKEIQHDKIKYFAQVFVSTRQTLNFQRCSTIINNKIVLTVDLVLFLGLSIEGIYEISNLVRES